MRKSIFLVALFEQLYHLMIIMLDLNPQYKTDEKGNRISVTVSIDEWHEIINEMQDLEMLRSLKKQEEEKMKSKYPGDDPGALFG
jgi:hypothetical protein